MKLFVELSAKASSPGDREKLRELCLGAMGRAFERMTEEMFQLSYVGNKVSIESLKILESKVTQGTAKVIYQVQTKNKAGSDPTVETIEREVELILSNNQWFLEHITPRGEDKIAFTRGMIF